MGRHVVATLGADKCHVAETKDTDPCFMQYLFFSVNLVTFRGLDLRRARRQLGSWRGTSQGDTR